MEKVHKITTVINVNDEWLTPPEIIKSLGKFDLDPCSPVNRPWPTANKHYTINDNGLVLPWHGRVWLNPPYGRSIGNWLEKISIHGNGIVLTYARLDTKAFFDYVYPFAASIFAFKGRIQFYNVNGERDKNGWSSAPSILIAYGKRNMEAIGDAGLNGRHILLNYIPVITVSVDRSWKTVVTLSLQKLNGTGSLKAIYNVVENLAPDKIRINQHYKAKVRQQLGTYFKRIKKGQYSI